VLQCDVECRGIAITGRNYRQDQLRATLIVDPITRISQIPLALGRVGLLGMNPIGKGIVEEQL
jgi:hypothetical protein